MQLDAEANIDQGIAFLTTEAFDAYRATIQQAQDALLSQVESLIASGGGGGAVTTGVESLALSNALESLVEKLRTVQRAKVLKLTVTV